MSDRLMALAEVLWVLAILSLVLLFVFKRGEVSGIQKAKSIIEKTRNLEGTEQEGLDMGA